MDLSGLLKLCPVVVPVRRVCRIACPSREVVAIVSVIRVSVSVVVRRFGASVWGDPAEMEMSVMDAECGLYDLRSVPRRVKRWTRPLCVPTACPD
jgi:hypothetical protein